MKNTTLALLFVIGLTTYANAQKVVGYLASWTNITTVNNLNYQALTDINYSFALPNQDGSVSLPSGWLLSALVTQAHQNGVKVHLSVGGALPVENATYFAQISADDATRASFIAELIQIVEDYDLDGIDMDWEFPAAGEASLLNDLLLDTKAALNILGMSTTKDYELTMAVPLGTWNSWAIGTTAISFLDYLMVMAYDFDPNTSHHSSMEVAESSLDFWINTKGAPAGKVILGLPFYSNVNWSQTSYRSLSWSDPAAAYNDADGVFNGFKYNSRPMLEEKIEMALDDRNCGGVMIWELSQDRTDNYSLLNVVGLAVGTIDSKEEIIVDSETLKAFPNPYTDDFSIDLSDLNINSEEITIEITDLKGSTVYSANHMSSERIKLGSELISGIYFGKAVTSEGTFTFKVVKT